MIRGISLFIAALTLIFAPLLAVWAQQGQPNFGQTVGPGMSSNVSVFYVQAAPVAFAALPVCGASNVGMRAWINNGAATPVWNAAAASGSTVFTPVLCSYTAATTYAWVND
jgi:hypothetical protein